MPPLRFLPVAALLLAFPLAALAQPTALRDDVAVERLGDTVGQPVRVAYDAVTDQLYYMNLDGEIYEMRFSSVFNPRALYRVDDHGLPQPRGMVFGPDGALYLAGNNLDRDAALNTGMIVRGVPTGNGAERDWQVVATTEPYPLSRTAFDHTVNAVEIDPEGAFLYVNSGSRTDHGELQEADGTFPGLREAGVTAVILRVPADTSDLLLLNDRTWLRDNGFVFAEGTRNHFDLAFNQRGHLLGSENSGDRDDNEELNWLREGRHYGFPWRMGMSTTPQQFTPYNPNQDPLVNPGAHAFNQGFFYNDPTYPAPPEGVTFTDAIPNYGPDADHYRDPADGLVKDASDQGTFVRSFTSHRSPLGLVFDHDSALAEPFRGSGFVMAWTGSESGLLRAMQDDGEDLLHLELTLTDTGYVANMTQIVTGFNNPIDAALVGDELYVVQYGGRDAWKITLPSASTVPNEFDTQPTAFELEQNYPNPFNPSTTIHFSVPIPAEVRLTVHDALGRALRTLALGTYPTGRHAVQFDASELPSGVYLYRLEAGDFVRTRSMHIVK